MPQITPEYIFGHWPGFTRNIPLADLTTFGIGGQAAWYLPVHSSIDLVTAIDLAQTYQLPYLLVAGGTNVVFSDKIIRRLIIHYQLSPRTAWRKITVAGQEVSAEAGVPLNSLVNRTAKFNLAGLEKLAGIPGTVGGAIVGNAGAYGQAISDYLTHILIADGRQVRWISRAEASFAYRHSRFKDKPWLVLQAKWQLPIGRQAELTATSRKIIKLRLKKYPADLACPGSFFKNVLISQVPKANWSKIDPDKIVHGKIPSGYLLEAVGACGLSVGGVAVAKNHGNLIFNAGGGRYREVRLLARQLKAKVRRRFNINLEEEIRYML